MHAVCACSQLKRSLVRALGCCRTFVSQESAYSRYLGIARNRRLNSAGQLSPRPTGDDEAVLRAICDDLPEQARRVVRRTYYDTGAGVGIHLSRTESAPERDAEYFFRGHPKGDAAHRFARR